MGDFWRKTWEQGDWLPDARYIPPDVLYIWKAARILGAPLAATLLNNSSTPRLPLTSPMVIYGNVGGVRSSFSARKRSAATSTIIRRQDVFKTSEILIYSQQPSLIYGTVLHTALTFCSLPDVSPRTITWTSSIPPAAADPGRHLILAGMCYKYSRHVPWRGEQAASRMRQLLAT